MLWAITSYFNPAGYRSRLANYRTFRKFLTVPLVAVELSFTGSFELEPCDADILVRLSGGDILWQKERLLNVALRHLPRDCDSVAWLDCDIIFATDDWAERARIALSDFAIVQLFSERCNLAPGATRDPSGWRPIELRAPAVGYTIVSGQLKADDLCVPGGFLTGGSTTGLAWAAQTNLLDKHGLYDVRIGGGGDRAIVCAALGRFDYCVEAQNLNRRQEEHYRAWGEPFFADVRNRVGYIEGRIFHLWHGDMKARHYARRHCLAELGFDPFTDIALGAGGCWRWATKKPALHEHLRSFFASRHEDGPPAMQEQS